MKRKVVTTATGPTDSAGVTARVEPGSCSKLAAGVYTITYLTDKVVDQTKVGPFLLGSSDCMNAPGGEPTTNPTQGGILLGTLVVDASGNGETSTFAPTLAETTPGSGDVCISDAGGLFGNAVPMKFL